MTDEIGLPDGVDHAERALGAFRSNGWTTRKCSNCAGSGRVLDVYTMESSCCYLCAGGGELSTHDEYAAMRAAVAEAVAAMDAEIARLRSQVDALMKEPDPRLDAAESELAQARAELGRVRELVPRLQRLAARRAKAAKSDNDADMGASEAYEHAADELAALTKEPTNG